MKRNTKGTTTVEFALAGVVLFSFILGVIEVGRAYYMTNVLGEVTRRGVRLATVCPINSTLPKTVAIMDRGNGTSAFIEGLTLSNIVVEYLDANSAVIANPLAATAPPVAFVRMRIVDYRMRLHMPFSTASFAAPEFPATLPRESLGIERSGAADAC